MRSLMLFLFLAIAAPLWAAQDVPVKITSDTMTYTQAGDQVVFKGKVYVIRQDIELWSDVLTVLLEKKDSPKSATQSVANDQGSIKKIIAQGNVRIKADKGRTGTSGKATYEADKDLLTMEDNPVLMEGANKIQGEVIKLFIKENRSEVLGGKGRVEAIFNTKGNTQGIGQ
ncbi:MAG: LptA/OstA family protein [Desulfomicrobium sp.]|nr:LptA/OstA family protein [Desulfomicrobium sp.]